MAGGGGSELDKRINSTVTVSIGGVKLSMFRTDDIPLALYWWMARASWARLRARAQTTCTVYLQQWDYVCKMCLQNVVCWCDNHQ